MGMSKVYNDSTFVWKEKFKGDDIVIPSGGFVEMEYFDAYAFKGQYAPIVLDANDQQIPESMKKIRIVGGDPNGPKAITEEMKCHKCKEQFLSFKTLNDHMAYLHKDDLVVDEEAEAEIAKKRRGRPAKDQTQDTA